MFKSGLFADYCDNGIRFSRKYSWIIADLGGPALSCWYKTFCNYVNENFWNAADKWSSSMLIYSIQLRRPS